MGIAGRWKARTRTIPKLYTESSHACTYAYLFVANLHQQSTEDLSI
jgi:hypothetical protein